MTQLIIGWDKPEWSREDAALIHALKPHCAMLKFGAEQRDRRDSRFGISFSLLHAFMRDCEHAEMPVMLDFKESQTADTMSRVFANLPWGAIRIVTIDGNVSGRCLSEAASCCREHDAQLAAVTIKTDMDDAECQAIYGCDAKTAALRLARRAKLFGAHGVVIPGPFVRDARREGILDDDNFFSIVAGIRMPGEHPGNHVWPVTPEDVAETQATHAVVQSSIWNSEDPVAIAETIFQTLQPRAA
ncbi:MAG: orotidine 5'-phosphate decarboxylase / HUMPS family protein [Minisyncoccia bacterium]